MADKNVKVYTSTQVDKLIKDSQGSSTSSTLVMEFELITSSDGSGGTYSDSTSFVLADVKYAEITIYNQQNNALEHNLFISDINDEQDETQIRANIGDKIYIYNTGKVLYTNINGKLSYKPIRVDTQTGINIVLRSDGSAEDKFVCVSFK